MRLLGGEKFKVKHHKMRNSKITENFEAKGCSSLNLMHVFAIDGGAAGIE